MNRALIEAYVTAPTLQAQKLAEAAIVTAPDPMFNDGVKYKLFRDLVFTRHPLAENVYKLPKELRSGIMGEYSRAKWARAEYANGYDNSILFGSVFYSNGINTYELGVGHGGGLVYDGPLTDDVIGHIPAGMVELFMVATQRLAPKH
jgi:hypothetical protein